MTALCYLPFILGAFVASIALGLAVAQCIGALQPPPPRPPLDLTPFILTGPADAAVNPEIDHG